MDENATHALNMAFAVIILVMALGISMRLFTRVSETADTLAYYSDSTKYYDNVELVKFCSCGQSNPVSEKKCKACGSAFGDIDDDQSILRGTERYVSAETVMPTLYRYYKENFCVKIYGTEASGHDLWQIFDVNLEGKVNGSIGDTNVKTSGTATVSSLTNKALQLSYNDPAELHYLFGAPWLGSTESVKTRIDLYVNGKASYINNIRVDYTDNPFYQARLDKKKFIEEFTSYSYTGQTLETDDGDVLVTGASAKDKIVITYTQID